MFGKKISTALLMGAFAINFSALAQDNLGAALDAGAKKLNGGAFNKELAGKTVSGTNKNGPFRLEFLDGGKLAGNFSASHGGLHPNLSGTWIADESGKVCMEYVYGVRKNREAYCRFYFKQGDQYFTSNSDSDRATWALPVQVAK